MIMANLVIIRLAVSFVFSHVRLIGSMNPEMQSDATGTTGSAWHDFLIGTWNTQSIIC